MAKPKTSVIKLKNDIIMDEFNGQNSVKTHMIDINNDKNNNNILNIITTNDKQDSNFTNFNKNFLHVNQKNEKILNNLIAEEPYDMNPIGNFQNVNNFISDSFVHDDLSLLPLIDDKAILTNLKTNFENQKYYVSLFKS